MKIAILSRNPHLYSTRRLKEAALERGHEADVIDFGKCSIGMEQGKPSVYYNGHLLEDYKAVIPRIGASITFYGTAIVRQFEMMKAFTTAESNAILRSRDKLRSLQVLSREGVGIPKTVFAKFPKNEDVDDLIAAVGGAPLIIKLLEGTQGLGVVLAERKSSAKSVIEAFSGLETNILVQEFIAESNGTDIRAFVVNGKVIGAMERKGKEGEFRSNLHRGGRGQVIQLTKKEASAAKRAAKAMGLDIAGVDMLRSSRGPLIIEVNSSPGLEGIERATGVDIAGEIIGFIEEKTTKKPRKTKPIKG